MAVISGTGRADIILSTGVSSGVTGGIPSAADDTVLGRGGDDLIEVNGGDDLVFGGGGDDTVVLKRGTVDFRGGGGTDTFVNGTSSYVTWEIFDYAQNSIEIVDGMFEYIRGTSDDDDLDFSSTALLNVAYIDGSYGDDRIVGADASNDDIRGNYDDDLLLGLTGNDIMDGGSGNDRMFGNGGKDTMYGGSGDDRVAGNSNHDLLIGGYGADTVEGGQGNDILRVDTTTEAEFDIMNGGGGTDQLLFTGAYLRLDGYDSTSNNIEIIRGTLEEIWGNTGNNTLDFSQVQLELVTFIDGWTGNDTIIGNGQNNDIRGGGGDDVLRGGGGNDSLDGDSGSDFVIGGGGDDVLLGGSDSNTDRFVFAGSHGNDIIRDFDDGEDLIQLDGYGIGFGALNITSQGGGADSLINLAGSGGGTIYLDGVTTGELSAADFLFT